VVVWVTVTPLLPMTPAIANGPGPAPTIFPLPKVLNATLSPGLFRPVPPPGRHRVGVAAHLSGASSPNRSAMGKASSIPRIAVVVIDRTKVDLEITDPEHFDTAGDRRSYPANRGGGMRRVGSCCLPEKNTSAIDIEFLGLTEVPRVR
jgi:hypothetical protein